MRGISGRNVRVLLLTYNLMRDNLIIRPSTQLFLCDQILNSNEMNSYMCLHDVRRVTYGSLLGLHLRELGERMLPTFKFSMLLHPLKI